MSGAIAPDPEGRTDLHQAAAHGDEAMVQSLIASGADVGAVDKMLMTPLHLACQQDHLTVARILIEAGAPIDVRDSYGNTPLWRAAYAFQGGEPELIRLLLAAGSDPDMRNNSGRSPRDMALTFDRPGIRAVF